MFNTLIFITLLTLIGISNYVLINKYNKSSKKDLNRFKEKYYAFIK